MKKPHTKIEYTTKDGNVFRTIAQNCNTTQSIVSFMHNHYNIDEINFYTHTPSVKTGYKKFCNKRVNTITK